MANGRPQRKPQICRASPAPSQQVTCRASQLVPPSKILRDSGSTCCRDAVNPWQLQDTHIYPSTSLQPTVLSTAEFSTQTDSEQNILTLPQWICASDDIDDVAFQL